MKKIALHDLQMMKVQGKPITMLTAYDYPSALLLDQCEVEMILVGDSLGMVVHGMDNTLGVTMDMMVMHCQAVRRGVKQALVVGDMPFMSYQTSISDALRNGGRLLAEGGVDAVKLEGGVRSAEAIRALVDSGVAVQGHIGLTPQSVSAFGGFKAQGKTVETARQLIADAQAIEQAGAFSIVLEAIPARLAALITQKISIPTIGIGAGVGCDGQVMVYHDILGLFDRFTPKFVKRYEDLAKIISAAVSAYKADVAAQQFPSKEHTFSIDDDVWQKIIDSLDDKSLDEM